jgi:hypothetical protein
MGVWVLWQINTQGRLWWHMVWPTWNQSRSSFLINGAQLISCFIISCFLVADLSWASSHTLLSDQLFLISCLWLVSFWSDVFWWADLPRLSSLQLFYDQQFSDKLFLGSGFKISCCLISCFLTSCFLIHCLWSAVFLISCFMIRCPLITVAVFWSAVIDQLFLISCFDTVTPLFFSAILVWRSDSVHQSWKLVTKRLWNVIIKNWQLFHLYQNKRLPDLR